MERKSKAADKKKLENIFNKNKKKHTKEIINRNSNLGQNPCSPIILNSNRENINFEDDEFINRILTEKISSLNISDNDFILSYEKLGQEENDSNYLLNPSHDDDNHIFINDTIALKNHNNSLLSHSDFDTTIDNITSNTENLFYSPRKNNKLKKNKNNLRKDNHLLSDFDHILNNNENNFDTNVKEAEENNGISIVSNDKHFPHNSNSNFEGFSYINSNISNDNIDLLFKKKLNRTSFLDGLDIDNNVKPTLSMYNKKKTPSIHSSKSEPYPETYQSSKESTLLNAKISKTPNFKPTNYNIEPKVNTSSSNISIDIESTDKLIDSTIDDITDTHNDGRSVSIESIDSVFEYDISHSNSINSRINFIKEKYMDLQIHNKNDSENEFQLNETSPILSFQGPSFNIIDNHLKDHQSSLSNIVKKEHEEIGIQEFDKSSLDKNQEYEKLEQEFINDAFEVESDFEKPIKSLTHFKNIEYPLEEEKLHKSNSTIHIPSEFEKLVEIIRKDQDNELKTTNKVSDKNHNEGKLSNDEESGVTFKKDKHESVELEDNNHTIQFPLLEQTHHANSLKEKPLKLKLNKLEDMEQDIVNCLYSEDDNFNNYEDRYSLNKPNPPEVNDSLDDSNHDEVEASSLASEKELTENEIIKNEPHVVQNIDNNETINSYNNDNNIKNNHNNKNEDNENENKLNFEKLENDKDKNDVLSSIESNHISNNIDANVLKETILTENHENSSQGNTDNIDKVVSLESNNTIDSDTIDSETKIRKEDSDLNDVPSNLLQKDQNELNNKEMKKPIVFNNEKETEKEIKESNDEVKANPNDISIQPSIPLQKVPAIDEVNKVNESELDNTSELEELLEKKLNIDESEKLDQNRMEEEEKEKHQDDSREDNHLSCKSGEEKEKYKDNSSEDDHLSCKSGEEKNEFQPKVKIVELEEKMEKIEKKMDKLEEHYSKSEVPSPKLKNEKVLLDKPENTDSNTMEEIQNSFSEISSKEENEIFKPPDILKENKLNEMDVPLNDLKESKVSEINKEEINLESEATDIHKEEINSETNLLDHNIEEINLESEATDIPKEEIYSETNLLDHNTPKINNESEIIRVNPEIQNDLSKDNTEEKIDNESKETEEMIPESQNQNNSSIDVNKEILSQKSKETKNIMETEDHPKINKENENKKLEEKENLEQEDHQDISKDLSIKNPNNETKETGTLEQEKNQTNHSPIINLNESSIDLSMSAVEECGSSSQIQPNNNESDTHHDGISKNFSINYSSFSEIGDSSHYYDYSYDEDRNSDSIITLFEPALQIDSSDNEYMETENIDLNATDFVKESVTVSDDYLEKIKLQIQEQYEKEIEIELNKKKQFEESYYRSLSKQEMIKDTLDEYELTITQMIDNTNKIKEKNNIQIEHLMNEINRLKRESDVMTMAYNELKAHYDQMNNQNKQFIKNKKILQENIDSLQNDVLFANQRYEGLKEHVESKINIANIEINKEKEHGDKEISVYKAKIRKTQLNNESLKGMYKILQEEFEAKTNENNELVQICDSLVENLESKNNEDR